MKTEVLRYESSEPVSLIFADSFVGEVDMGTWEISADRLFSMGVLTCIVLAAHNDETNRGLLGHFSAVAKPDAGYSDKQIFQTALKEVANLGDPLATSLFLGGGTAHDKTGIDTVEPDRRYAEERVREFCSDFRLPNDQVSIEWSQPDRAIDVELDCATGILAVHNSPKNSMRIAFASKEAEA